MVASFPAEGRVAADNSPPARGPEPEAPLTVLQVLPRLDIGGVERGALDISRAVTEAGGRALVACAGGRLARRLAGFGGELVEAPLASKNPAVILANARRLERAIQERGVDLVHARSRAPAWSAWLAARRTGRPFVTTWHGVYSEAGRLKRTYNSVMAKGRPVIAVSRFVAEMIAARHDVPPERIETIPRGVDLDVFSESAVGVERTIAVMRAWSLVDDPRPVVILPGRISRWKGQEVFVEAAARLKALRGRGDFLFLVLGADPGSEAAGRLLRLAKAQDALDVVRVAPALDDMAAALKLAAVVVSASTEPEAFGRVAVEGQAMGRPVIATDHGGARETVAPGETGWLTAPGDAGALARVAEEALSLAPERRAAMAAAGRARVAERFSLAEMRRRTLAVYEDVAGRAFA